MKRVISSSLLDWLFSFYLLQSQLVKFILYSASVLNQDLVITV